MKYVGNVQSQANSEVYATASGALPNGTPVVVNSDGSVSVISETETSFGTAVQFDTNATDIASAFDPDNNKIVIAYQDGSNSNYGTAVVATISGNNVSFGTAVVFASGVVTQMDICYDTNANKFVVTYNLSSAGRARVGTVSGTNISFGSEVVFKSASISFNATVFDSNLNKVVTAWSDSANSDYGTAIVGTVSGTNISFGTAVVIKSVAVYYKGSTFDSNSNKVVISYYDSGNGGKGTAIVGTVSGTGISFGSEVVFGTAAIGADGPQCDFNSADNKVLIVFVESSKSKAIVGTVSGTNISFGTLVSTGTNDTWIKGLAYDVDNNRHLYMSGEQNAATSAYNSTIRTVTISGTTPIFGDPAIFDSDNLSNPGNGNGVVYDTNANKFLLSYATPNSSPSPGRSVVVANIGSSNLTTENFVGITNGVVEYDAGPAGTGSAVVFENATINEIGSAYDVNAQRVVIAYRDGGNSNYGTAVIGTLSGTSISFGTPVVFESASARYSSVAYDVNAQKVVIAYKDVGNSNASTAIVGTVSGTTISFGTAVVFDTDSSNDFAATYDANAQKVVIAYMTTNNNGIAIVGTVSGTGISFGTAVQLENSRNSELAITYDSSAQKVVVAYKDLDNSNYGTAIVGTVSGTNISFGTPVVYNTATSTKTSITFDSTLNKVVIIYRNQGNSSYGTAIVGTVSGTGISFGTAVVFNSDQTTFTSATYDTNAQKVVISYQDSGNSDLGTLVIGTVSGTAISFGSEVVFQNAVVGETTSVFDSNTNKVVIAYKLGTTGTGIVFQNAFDDTVRGSTASGSTAIIQAGGAVNTLQTGLTPGQQYFLQADGTLGLTADDPSVIAGTAVSATDLIVKG